MILLFIYAIDARMKSKPKSIYIKYINVYLYVSNKVFDWLNKEMRCNVMNK